MDWRHRASCRDEDPELFHPVGNSGPALLQIAEAKTVCQRCPVRAQCLTEALGIRDCSGVWGGLSEDERRALQRRNARTRAKATAAEQAAADAGDRVLLAIAGDGVMHEADSRWHAPHEQTDRPACSTLVQRPMRRPMAEVPVARRCRQKACRARWAALDEQQAVSHG
jgi:WhiB family redox-sensing transcriptional regulator